MATIQDIFDWLNQGAQGDIPGTGGSQPNVPASSDRYSGSSIPGTQDTPSSGGAPGSADRNSFWNQNQIAPYNPPGQADDRTQEAAERQQQQGRQAGQKAGQGIAQMLFGKPQQQPKTVTVDPDTMSNLSFTGLGNLLDQYHGIVGGTTPGNYAGDVPPKYLNYYNYLIQGGLPPDVAHQIITQPSYGEEQGQVPYRDEWPYAYAGHDQELSGAVSGQEPRDQGLADQVWQSIQNQIYGGWQQGV